MQTKLIKRRNSPNVDNAFKIKYELFIDSENIIQLQDALEYNWSYVCVFSFSTLFPPMNTIDETKMLTQ